MFSLLKKKATTDAAAHPAQQSGAGGGRSDRHRRHHRQPSIERDPTITDVGSASLDEYDDDASTFADDRSKSGISGGGSSSSSRHRPSGSLVAGAPPTRTPTAERQSRYHDEPEVDYDEDATGLYQLIENKDWDAAMARIERAPYEARTWVSRREAHDSSKLRWRLLPIHATCVFRSPLSLIERLLDAYPDGSQMKDDQGMLPVHLACRNGASKGVVITLLNSFPESVSVKDRKGRVPLTLVENSSSQNREAVIVAIKKFQAELEAKTSRAAAAATTMPAVAGGAPALSFPAATAAQSSSSARAVTGPSAVVPPSSSPAPVLTSRPTAANGAADNEVDYEHRTVLFRLVLKKDWDGASRRASDHPEEAGTWIVTKGFNGNLRFLPIHKACVLQPPASAVEALVSSHPDGASSRDQDGWLPLHCACFYGAGEPVVSALLIANPKAAQCKDDEGRLPLHYSCLKSAPADVVGALLRSFPRAAMSKDDEGRLPIHHACSKGAGPEVIEALLRASPKGAQSKDDQGRLPLHHACRKGASERVVTTLLKVYPRGAQAKDDQDKLPLHYACQAGASDGVIKALLAAYPESVEVKNGFGYTPLAEARAMGGDNPKIGAIVALLEKAKLEQDEIRARNGLVVPRGGGNAVGSGGMGLGVIVDQQDRLVLSTPISPLGRAGPGGAGLVEVVDPAAAAAAAAASEKRTSDLVKQVSELTGRVRALEEALSGIGRLGAELRNSIVNAGSGGGSSAVASLQDSVGKFADKLAETSAKAIMATTTPTSPLAVASTPNGKSSVGGSLGGAKATSAATAPAPAGATTTVTTKAVLKPGE